jgi:SAM-dependent methyltransferase
MTYPVLFQMESLPVFQNKVFATAAAALACPRGDLQLRQDESTGIVANAAFDPALVEYDEDYQNEQGHSAVFRTHLRDIAELVGTHARAGSVVEIGCGKGTFLELLQSRGLDVVGMDPAYEGINHSIRKESFMPGTSVRGEVLVLRHVLEHVQSPLDFLALLRQANGGTGLIYIEVPCLDWIAANQAWFDLFYEHVNYFRLQDFERMFDRVIEVRRTFGGQYLSVVADLASLRQTLPQASVFSFPTSFTRARDAMAARLREGRPCLVWGASSKGVIFALHMARVGTPVRRITDINPSKQGMFLPAVGLQVQPPESALDALPPGSDVLVMNPNYLAEVRQAAGDQFNYLTLEDGQL